jgi:hypothetical protein
MAARGILEASIGAGQLVTASGMTRASNASDQPPLSARTLTGALHISRNGAKGYALVTASGFVKLDAEANMPLIV